MIKNIVILGGSYAGVNTAHRILKQTDKTTPIKVTIVSPNTHFYWSMASSRGFVPGQFADDELFRSIEKGFEGYSGNQFEFILGAAESLDVNKKSVRLSTGRDVKYDYLILATGSRYNGSFPFKGIGSTEETKSALHDYQTQIKSAKTIVVAGGGVTGIELAGEIAYEYGREKEVILIASTPTLLSSSPSFISQFAEKELKNLHVDIKLKTKVLSTTTALNNHTRLTLSNNETLLADLYIPTFGVIPNSSYIPSKFLNEKGYVTVDEHLNVKGTKDIWAIGDVSDVELSQFIYADKQSKYLAKQITRVVGNRELNIYKAATTPFFGFQVGKKAATLHYGNWIQMPRFVVVYARRNLFLEQFEGMLTGSGL